MDERKSHRYRNVPRVKLLLGEWACLGVLSQGHSHGFAVAQELKPTGAVGRVWASPRSLVYRSLDRLQQLELITPIGEEPGVAGGNRTIFSITTLGKAKLREWLKTPVSHLRDIRSEFLLKLVLCEQCGVSAKTLISRQNTLARRLVDSLTVQLIDTPHDAVLLWRFESASAAVRFLKRLPHNTK